MTKKCLQKKYSPKSVCFGCGPANPQGLHVQSFVHDEKVVAHWTPQVHHQAFPGVLNGGIIGALLDCHSNWTAAWHLMNINKLEHPPCTVTAEYSIKLLRPTPTHQELQLIAWVVHSESDRATVHAELYSEDKLCAKCQGTFVSVKMGHPAFHRW